LTPLAKNEAVRARLFFSDHLLGCGFRLALFFQSVAVAADVDDGGAMEQAVQSSRSHDGIAGEDLVPVGEGFVAGENDGLLFFVTFTDGLEQEAGVRGLQREIANFINDQ